MTISTVAASNSVAVAVAAVEESSADCYAAMSTPTSSWESESPTPDGLLRDTTTNNTALNASSTGTTVRQTFIHLTKGYIGPGCLSLPWAVSQLGSLPGGLVAIVVVSYWTSYNCWMLVRLKQRANAMERNNNNSAIPPVHTFADVSGWLLGPRGARGTTICILVQQLAVCTVFFSFLGANVQAVWREVFPNSENALGHGPAIALCLPAVLALTCLPNLKALAPATAVGTALLFSGFACLFVVICLEWGNHTGNNDNNNNSNNNALHANPWNFPIAICAILYSYEGVCLMLPVENAMQEPTRFGKPFVASMTLTAGVFCLVAALSVLAFGPIQNGSITAYLLETYTDNNDNNDESDNNNSNSNNNAYIRGWIVLANALVSLSVLVTYPLQMFPALELANPWVLRQQQKPWSSHYGRSMSAGQFASVPAEEAEDATANVRGNNDSDDSQQQQQRQPLAAINNDAAAVESALNHMENNTNCQNNNNNLAPLDIAPGAQPLQRGDGHVTDNDTDEDDTQLSTPAPLTRVLLVLLTFILAVAVPNVQALISLSGALSGSTSTLLLPPALQIAYLKRYHPETTGAARLAVYYTLFGLGVVFLCLGTGASLFDIVKIYADQ